MNVVENKKAIRYVKLIQQRCICGKETECAHFLELHLPTMTANYMFISIYTTIHINEAISIGFVSALY